MHAGRWIVFYDQFTDGWHFLALKIVEDVLRECLMAIPDTRSRASTSPGK
jgi:hypothetical protein